MRDDDQMSQDAELGPLPQELAGLEEPTQPPAPSLGALDHAGVEEAPGEEAATSARALVASGLRLEPSSQPTQDEPGPPPRHFTYALIEQLFALADDLRGRQGVIDVRFDLDRPAPEFAFTTIENSLGRELPEDIKSLYRVTNGFELSWDVQDERGRRQRAGHLKIYDVATVFGFWFDTLWPHDPSRDERELDFLWSMRGLDPGPEAPHGAMTALRLEGDWGQDYSLWLVQEHQLTGQLAMDLMSYVYYGLETRGLTMWREVLSDQAPMLPPSQGQRFLDQLARFFPEVDPAPYMALMPGLRS